MWKNAMWLGIPKSELVKWNILEGDLTGRFAYYRCEIELKEAAELTIDISANSRYRLWINEIPVLSGPCKGDLYRHYYETMDVSKYLKTGRNIFAVQVLYSNAYTAIRQTDERAGIFGVLTPGGGHRLAVEGEICNCQSGKVMESITTGLADWRVWLDGSFYLKSYAVTENLGAVCEEPDFKNIPADWKCASYCCKSWAMACALEEVVCRGFWEKVGITPRFSMKERAIPLLYEKEGIFEKEIETSRDEPTHILERGAIQLAADEKRRILLDAGTIINAYPRFVFSRGKDAAVHITYFEKFENKEKEIRRDDAENGRFSGITDSLILSGRKIVYEPFWYRTFRFVAIEIETGQEGVVMEAPAFRKTGYPLKIGSQVRSSQNWVNDVWSMCVRTLENCMMETYMDCPYYEQMQFSMDTRLQALFTYLVSADVRLAKKALEDYHCSMTPDGLIHGKYPSAYTQIISTFSLHYIYMLKEYYWQTADLRTVRKYFPDMDKILDYYDSKMKENGLVGRLGYWEFVDWQPAWEQSGGMPEALQYGPSTIINFMYCYALKCAAELNETAGRTGMAMEYRQRRDEILQVIQEKCWDSDRGMYREGPEFAQYTCHAQAWAVLNELPDVETSKKILLTAANEADVLKCTFSTSYEWFRACEAAGVYECTKRDMEQWIRLLSLGCTCCPETPGDTRSDCHAWSALPMYEMICCMAGIRAERAGWERIRICPHLEDLPDLEGMAMTPKGEVEFSYIQNQSEDGRLIWKCRVKLPEGTDGVFVDTYGNETELSGGQQYELRNVRQVKSALT